MAEPTIEEYKESITLFYNAIIAAEKMRENESFFFVQQNLVWGVILGRCEKLLGIPLNRNDKTD